VNTRPASVTSEFVQQLRPPNRKRLNSIAQALKSIVRRRRYRNNGVASENAHRFDRRNGYPSGRRITCGSTVTFFLTRLVVVIALLGATGVVDSHPAPFSYLDLYLESDSAGGALVIHDFDAAHELRLAKPELLLDVDIARAHRDTLVTLLESRLTLSIDDKAVIPAWRAIEVLSEKQSVRLSFNLNRPTRGKLEITAALFPYDAAHQTFINIYEHGTLKQQAILDSRRQSMAFYSGDLQGRLAVVTAFATAGIQHILIGPDHVLFLFGLMLLGGSWWRLAAIVTAFTVGHSITLSLAVLGLVHLSPAVVEPAIALSIIVVGVDNLLVSRQRTRSGAVAARDLRAGMAGTFGLIHGFGFAGVLIELGLPREARGWSLAAFNIGVEAGQLLIVVVVILLGLLAKRLPFYRTTVVERFLTLASVAVIGAGVYWLAQRVGLLSAV